MHSPDQNVERNRQLLLERSLAGLQKYGTTTERGDLTLKQWLQHLLEELLDAANYIQAAMSNNQQQEPRVNGYTKKLAYEDEALVDRCNLLEGLLLWALYHHQGANSVVGQPIRQALGMSQSASLSTEQINRARAAGEKQ